MFRTPYAVRKVLCVIVFLAVPWGCSIQQTQTPGLVGKKMLPYSGLPRLPSRLSRDAINHLWQELGVRSDVFDEDDSLSARSDRRGGFLLIVIHDEFPCDWQYLVFRKEETGLVFLGNIDLPCQKYVPPRYDLVELGQERFLVVRQLSCSGSGCMLYEDVWWVLEEGGIRVALVVPIRGHIVGWGMVFEREFDGRVVSKGIAQERPYVDVEFSARYWDQDAYGGEDDHPLFSYQKKARFVWQSVMRSFFVDDTCSSLSTEQIDGLFGDGEDGFLRHNFVRLSSMALDGQHREWLQKLLGRCADGPEKQTLSRVLARGGSQRGK